MMPGQRDGRCHRPGLRRGWLLLAGAGLLAACDGSDPASTAGQSSGGSAGAASGGRGGQGGAQASGGASGGSAAGPSGGGSGGGTGGSPASDGPPTSGDGGDDAPAPPPVGSVVVEGLKGAHVYFNGTMDNKRRANADVEFPALAPGRKVSLRLRLRCPTGGCDYWDRWAYLGIVRGATVETETVTEIMRFVTPYRLGADWTVDVSDLQPLLAGKVRLRAFIDTWVAPGNPQGGGWLVDATFTFSPDPNPATRMPAEVIPLWDVGQVGVGDPAKPVADLVPARMPTIPADAVAVSLRSFITGHGQGNLQNCAEFCPKNHAYTVGGMPFSRRVWRDNCEATAVPNQAGNWKPSRAGWCPGALVEPWSIDVTAVAKAGAPVSVSYAPEAYVNTCRPDSPMCTGCVFNTPCAYDEGPHTAPSYLHSALLVVYKAVPTR